MHWVTVVGVGDHAWTRDPRRAHPRPARPVPDWTALTWLGLTTAPPSRWRLGALSLPVVHSPDLRDGSLSECPCRIRFSTTRRRSELPPVTR